MYVVPDDPNETSDDLTEFVNGVIGCHGWGIGCRQLGSYQDGTRTRPNIFRVASGRLREVILQHKAELRNRDDCSHIYISPDRSPKEREERRRLVAELKERRAADPGKTFFIKAGKVTEKVDE